MGGAVLQIFSPFVGEMAGRPEGVFDQKTFENWSMFEAL
jgi:hypothetical protein